VEQSLTDARKELAAEAGKAEKREVLDKWIAALEEQLNAIRNAEVHGYRAFGSVRSVPSTGSPTTVTFNAPAPGRNLGFGSSPPLMVICSKCNTAFATGLLDPEPKCPACGEIKKL